MGIARKRHRSGRSRKPTVSSAKGPREARRDPRDLGPTSVSPATVERILDSQDWSRLPALLAGAEPSSDEAASLLRRQCALVLEWNRGISNLISKNDERRIVSRHVLESLEPARWIAKEGIDEWLDFGSGAGFPAVPLAIAGVGKRWILVESRRPKTLFLRKLLSVINIHADIEVRHARLESLVGDVTPAGGFTSRATERLGPTLKLAASFVRHGGSAFLWKGSSWIAELESDPSWKLDWSLEEHTPLSSSQAVVAKFIRR